MALLATFTLSITDGTGVIPDAIADLVAGFVDPADPEGALLPTTEDINDPLILEWTALDDAEEYEARFLLDGVAGEIIPLSFVADAFSSFIFATEYEVEVRGVSAAGRKGPWSNQASFIAYTPSITVIDSDVVSTLGIGSAYTGFSFDSMNGGALSRAASTNPRRKRWLLVISHGPGGSSTPTETALGTGWLAVPQSFKSFSGQGVRAAMKEIVGDETTVQLLSSGSGSNTRFSAFACVLEVVGTLEMGLVPDVTDPVAQAGTSDPGGRTSPISAETEPIFVISSAAGTSSLPDQTWQMPSGTTLTPDENLPNDASATVGMRTRTKWNIIDAHEARDNVFGNMGDNGNNSYFQACFVARVPE